MFFQPAEPLRTPAVVQRPAWTGAPLTWRLLVVLVEEAEVEGITAKLTRASRASILDAHASIEAWIERHTFGQVDMVVETITIPQPLVDAFSGEEGEDRFRIEPNDLPADWLPGIEAGRYASIYVWAPIPAGYPMPKLGWTWNHTTLRGATVVVALPFEPRETASIRLGLTDREPGWLAVREIEVYGE